MDLALRVTLWVLRRYLGEPGRSWLLASVVILGFQVIRSVAGRRPLVETIGLKPGDRYVIEHLRTTHAQQMKATKSLSG